MNKILTTATAAAMVAALAAPALADSRGIIVLTPGSSAAGDKQPTSYMSTETARVLPDGQAYLTGGPGINYRRGIGGGELGLGVNLNAGIGGASAFTAGLNAGYKLKLAPVAALNANVAVGGLGTGTNTLGATVGLPLTFEVGMGAFTAQPRVNFPALTAGTTGAKAEVALGYQAPIAPATQLIAEIVPGMPFSGGFSAPIGIGTRFSPTATSHVDFTFGNVSGFSPFVANLGTLAVTGHIGF